MVARSQSSLLPEYRSYGTAELRSYAMYALKVGGTGLLQCYPFCTQPSLCTQPVGCVHCFRLGLCTPGVGRSSDIEEGSIAASRLLASLLCARAHRRAL